MSYEFKYVCESCGAIHYYNPSKGCCRCGHKKLKKVRIGKGKKK